MDSHRELHGKVNNENNQIPSNRLFYNGTLLSITVYAIGNVMKAELQEIIELLNGPDAYMLHRIVDEDNVYEVILELLQDHSNLIIKLNKIHTSSDY